MIAKKHKQLCWARYQGLSARFGYTAKSFH